MARAKQKNGAFVDLSGVKISGHALKKFCERHEEVFGEPPILPEMEIRRMLSRAQEVMRRMGFISSIFYSEKSRYWRAGGWYFVTDMRVTTLITAYKRTQGMPRWRSKRTDKN